MALPILAALLGAILPFLLIRAGDALGNRILCGED